MIAKYEELIEGFVTGKIGISENFLSISLAAALQQNLHRLDDGGFMIQAGIGNAAGKTDNKKIRGDTTCWLQDNTTNDAELEFMEQITHFMEHLNRTCYTGLNACEFHYALYETGTFYSRHKDRFRNDDNRKFSMISYLNTGWQKEDGGQLIIHNEDAAQQISPTNQKAVFFQSDVLEHEVGISFKPRMSITGWLKRV